MELMQGFDQTSAAGGFSVLWGRGRRAQRCGRLNCFFLGPLRLLRKKLLQTAEGEQVGL